MRHFYYILTCYFLLISQSLNAGHIDGGSIRYEPTTISNQYKIYLELYVTCALTAPLTMQVTFDDDCSSVQFTQSISYDYSEEISQYCPSYLGTASCQFSPGIRIEKWVYSGLVTLSTTCASWRVSYSTTDTRVTDNLTIFNGFYFESTINNSLAQKNTSVLPHAPPVPYLCVNQPAVWNLGVTDVNCDSLVFELISPRISNGMNVTFLSGFSATSPIPGMSINSETGDISFTPTMAGKFSMAVIVKEYNDAGSLIGTFNIDFPIYVEVCSNNPPVFANISNFNNYGTGATLSGNGRAIDLCGLDRFSFDLALNDADLSDTLEITTNIASVLPNVIVSYTGGNPLIAHVYWDYDPGFQPEHILFKGTDNVCNIYGVHFYVLEVNAPLGINISYQDSICGSMEVYVSSMNLQPLTWTVVTGDPIVIGTNFSCNNCPEPVIKPSISTTYTVSDMSNCALTVPVTINVINGNLGDLNSVILNVDTTVCQGDCFEVESISSKTIEYPQYSTIPTSTPLTIGTSQSAVQMAFVPSTVINTPLIQQGSIDQICLDITHTEVGALDLELESPAGTIFELSSGNGGQGNNYTSTCFTASSNTTIQSGSPPYTGNYIPEAGSLANAFVGESVSGLWKLHINNNSSVNAGVLNNWSIKFVSIITSEVTADSLSWWSVNGLSDTTIASPILCPNQSGQYVLTSYNEYGCWGSSDTLNVLMNPAPNSGIDTTIVIDVYNGPFNLFSYLSSTANLNLGAFYDTLYSSYMLPVVNPDTLENPSTFLYITENTLHCTDTAALTVNIVGYCVTPPNPPNPNIAPLPNAGNDVNINLGISQGTVSLFWYLDSGVPTTGNWFDSLGNAILAAVDLSTVQTTSVYTYILANANGCLDTSYLTLTVVDDLSFDNYELTSLVSLYPNPTNGEVLVKSEISELVNIRIYNQFGQLVKEVNGVNKTERISLESLASGLYYFKVTNLSGTFHFAEKIQLLRF